MQWGLGGQMLSGVATMIAVRRWLMIIKDRLTNSMRGSPNLSLIYVFLLLVWYHRQHVGEFVHSLL